MEQAAEDCNKVDSVMPRTKFLSFLRRGCEPTNQSLAISKRSVASNFQTNNTITNNINVAKKNVDIRSFSSVAAALEQQYNSYDQDYSHLYNTTYHPQSPEPNYTSLGPTSKLNLFTAINSAMQTAMKTDDTAIVFGEDVSFGGVFRCSQNLREEFGEERVFNTPLSENGIAVRVCNNSELIMLMHFVIDAQGKSVYSSMYYDLTYICLYVDCSLFSTQGMAIGYASAGGTAIGEIQFGDYIFPAFDQIVNEMAKFRYVS